MKMKALSSNMGRPKASQFAGIGVLAIAAILLLVMPIFAFAAGPYVDVSASYAAGTVTVSGTVVPNPGANQEVSVSVSAPNGAGVLSSVVPVNSATGGYTYSAAAGGNPNWVNGTYTVQVTWGTLTQAYTNSTTFKYGAATTTSTSSSTSSSTSKSTTTTSSSTSSTTSSASSGPTATTIVTSLFTTVTQVTTVNQITTVNQVTTVNQAGQTVNQVTTVNQAGQTVNQVTTVNQAGQTVTQVTTVSQVTTVTSTANVGTAEAIGAVGVVIAIIAGALAAMALRKH